jgi:hypothetical protein
LKIVFDYQDDEQDKQQADIKSTRAKTRQTDIAAGVVDIRVARQDAVSAGDLTDDQYAYLERQDGRLPDGTDLLTLFESPDPVFVQLLDLKTEFSPLLVEAHDPIEMVVTIDQAMVNAARLLHKATGRAERSKIEQASDALSALKDIYEPLVAEQVITDTAVEDGTINEGGGQDTDDDSENDSSEEAPQSADNTAKTEQEETEADEEIEEEAEEAEEEEAEEDDDVEEKALAVFVTLRDQYPTATDDQLIDVIEKGFNFGARVGEVIRGALARGQGGRFANAAELEQGRLDMIRSMLARLGAKLSPKGGAAAAKKLANQKKVDAALAARGIEPGTLDALNAMRAGETPDDATLQALQDRGLVQQNSDGTFNMTPDGRAVRAAGDSGDVDRATGILAPKEPKAPKAGSSAKPKKDPAKVAEAKRVKQGVERAEAREAAFAEVERDAGVESADLTSLTQFVGKDVFGSDGAELGNIDALPDDVATRLAQAGFVKFDTAGKPVVTSAGRSLVSAAEKGDASRIAAAVSSANDAIVRTRQRIDERTERAEAAAEKADGYRDEIAAAEVEAEEKVNKANSDIAETEAEIESLQAELDKLADSPRTAQRREEIETSMADAAARIEQRRQDIKDIGDDLAESTKTTRERLEREEERAAGYLEEADELERSIGGGEEKSLGDFAAAIRASVRGLWAGATDEFLFVDGMISALRRGLTQAWHEGAQSCGIQPDEMTQQEKDALSKFINEQTLHVSGFGRAVAEVRDIRAQSPRDPAARLDPLLSRAELWIRRYGEAVTLSKAMACGDKKMKWILGEAEHCSSCIKLNGKVKRASFWAERGILPQVAGAEYLECKGFNCACQLVETTDRLSRGPLPGLP